ncbi:hypothetical protein DICA4_F38468 [Diutina catenulata]
MRFSLIAFWAAWQFFFVRLNALEVTEDTIEVFSNGHINEDMTIAQGVSLTYIVTYKYWQVGYTLTNNGEFYLYPEVANMIVYVSSTKSITNNGIMVIGALDHPSRTDLDFLPYEFDNHGELFILSNNVGIESSSNGWKIYAPKKWYNSGYIVLYSLNKNWKNPAELTYQNSINDGDILFHNLAYGASSYNPKSGTGCLHFSGASFFYNDETSLNQTVQFEPGSTTLVKLTVGKPWYQPVRGFGEGMGFGAHSLSSFSYDGTHLILKYGTLVTEIDIGQGYDESLFYQTKGTDWDYSLPYVVAYAGPVPAQAARAEVCRVCPPIPEAPRSTTSTWTTTDEEGKTRTDSGVIEFTTTSKNSWITTTSLFPTCEDCTEYTSTCVTTDSNGVTSTESGVIEITTNSGDEVITTTSVFPQPTCEECTEYTSTWETTDEDGSTATDSGVVIVTTDEDGSLTTSTSSIPRPTCEECTEYTSTWETTDEDGSTATDSGVVTVTTDEDGSLTTLTSSDMPLSFSSDVVFDDLNASQDAGEEFDFASLILVTTTNFEGEPFVSALRGGHSSNSLTSSIRGSVATKVSGPDPATTMSGSQSVDTPQGINENGAYGLNVPKIAFVISILFVMI